MDERKDTRENSTEKGKGSFSTVYTSIKVEKKRRKKGKVIKFKPKGADVKKCVLGQGLYALRYNREASFNQRNSLV